MIYPIFVYGQPVLRKVAQEITPDYSNLNELIADMFETMKYSDGIGLAAPQIGKSIRLIVIDAEPLADDDPSMKDFRKVIINPRIIEETGDEVIYNEGCLSLPGIREDVSRKSVIRVRYVDENFKSREETYDGFRARIIQHEYDHLEGILFVDRLGPLKKRLLKGKLNDIMRGKIECKYRIKTVK